jgi:hypothetical protein
VLSLCEKISGADGETRDLRGSIQWFLAKHLGAGGSGDKGKAIDDGRAAMEKGLKKGRVI